MEVEILLTSVITGLRHHYETALVSQICEAPTASGWFKVLQRSTTVSGRNRRHSGGQVGRDDISRLEGVHLVQLVERRY